MVSSKSKETGASPFTRATLQNYGWEAVHRPRNFTKADVLRLEWPPQSGEWVILKDLSRRPLWFRLLGGRALMAREWRALQALQSLDVAPPPVARVDADAIVMGFVPGAPLGKRATPEEAAPLLQQTEKTLREIHALGVTHGDLHRANLLFDETGRARIVDWATGSVFSSRPLGPKKRALQFWKRLDERALAKLKKRHAPALLTDEEKALLQHRSPLERGVRGFGKWFRSRWGFKRHKK